MSNHPVEQAFDDIHFAEKKPPRWVIKDTVPVGFTILAGPPKKAYKSTLTIIKAILCAGWKCDALPCWMSCELPGPTMLISCEADAGTILYLIEEELKVPTEPGSIYVAKDTAAFNLSDPDKANELLDYLDEKDPRLVVADPFRNLWEGDENDSGEIMRILTPLIHRSHRRNSAFIMVHHINKPGEGKDKSSFYIMRGSGALPGAADGLLTIEDTKEEGNIIINGVFKRGESWRRKIHLGVPGFGWGRTGHEVMTHLAGQVLELMNQGITHPHAIAQKAKKSVAEVDEAIKELKRNGAIE